MVMAQPKSACEVKSLARRLCYGIALLALSELSGAASAADIDVSQYEKIVKDAEATPAWNGPTEPAKAPKNKFLVEIACTHAVEGCKKESGYIEEAANRLGWRYKVIVVSDPTRYDAAVQTGINAGADGIFLNGVDTKLISGGIASAKAKKIPIVSSQMYNEVGPHGVDAEVDSDAAQIGNILAASAIVNEKGKMHVLMLNIAEWPLPVKIMNSVKETFDTCTQCEISYAKPIDFTSAVIGTTLPQQVVAAVRRDPKINVIVEGIDPMANFIVPALNAAGMRDKVRMYSTLANPGPLQLLRDGNVLAADVGVSLKWGVWGAIDKMIRLMNGQRAGNETVPVQLLLRSAPENLPPPGEAYTGDASGFVEKYLALWGVN
jgi:ribose transport system substrate-binding protein